MIGFAPHTRVYLALGATDMRKQIDGLAVLVEEVLRAGASGFVVKNSASTDLYRAIDAVRTGASFLSPAIAQQVVDAIGQPGNGANSGV